MTVHRILVMVLLIGLLSPASANAQARAFLGGSLGTSFYKTDITELQDEDFKLEENEFAWKIFGGLRALRLTSVEFGYRNLGKVQNTVADVNLEHKTSGWDLFFVPFLSTGPVDVFGKLGYLWWRSETKIEEDPFDTKGGDFAWGFGGAIRLRDAAVRIEWERFEVEGADYLSMATAGVVFYF
jgi:hypothetical protein